MNFNNVKIIKKLGTGMFGTTYLCNYENKKYALKIEHILEENKKKDFNNQMWREIDLYKYIDTMPKKDQIFFTRLHAYEIYDNCTHKQIRPFPINMDDIKNEFAQKLKKLDNSTWCVKYLLDYKGKTNLGDFLIKNSDKLKIEQVYSIVCQIIYIIMLLHKKGYSHNDLHPKNIMITKTDKKYFTMNNIRIPFNGYLISSIDYGEVLNSKFNIKYKDWRKDFIKNNKQWLFNELYFDILNVISNMDYAMDCCDKLKKKLPWEKNPNNYSDAIRQIICNHTEFFNEATKKYIILFPKGKKLIDKLYKSYLITKSKKPIYKIIGEDKNSNDFYSILNRVRDEFDIKYPKLFKKYFGWCCESKWLISNDDCLEYFMINNTDDLIKFWLKKI